MESFKYIRASDAGGAVAAVAAEQGATFLAGGTGLVDLMKLGVQNPAALVDVARLPLTTIEAGGDSIRIGAMARNSDVAWHDAVRTKLPALSQALLSGASPQLRNMATVGGNIMQRTRCTYFRDGHSPCNKRQPGAGCAAIDGVHRMHAILGVSDKCFAAHPSDMCVALAAFDAVVQVRGPKGERQVPFAEVHIAYGDDPAKETTLSRDELIEAVAIPLQPWYARSHYLKVRDRESYEFALASAAVALDIAGGSIRQARIALGGVAGKPWRAIEAEKLLAGKSADDGSFKQAAELAVSAATPRRDNAFKVELAKRVIVRALAVAAKLP